MSRIHFSKWQGAGNDFIIIDHREPTLTAFTPKLITFLCDRHFGIGADGLMLIHPEQSAGVDFRMQYFNSDGFEATMCGNGGRCIAAMAHELGIFTRKTMFSTAAGIHEALVRGDDQISLKMLNVNSVQKLDEGLFMNTGVPHLVVFVDDLEQIDVMKEGSKLRYSDRFKPEGTNVNFVEYRAQQLFIRTYERGVEGETLACGTGIVASALAAASTFDLHESTLSCVARGGRLSVDFTRAPLGFTNIWLTGGAVHVFDGMCHTDQMIF